jgi:hypothetical protein
MFSQFVFAMGCGIYREEVQRKEAVGTVICLSGEKCLSGEILRERRDKFIADCSQSIAESGLIRFAASVCGLTDVIREHVP